MLLGHGIVIGLIVGIIVGWKIHAWWSRSAVKKAANAAKNVTQGPWEGAKSLLKKAKDKLDGKKPPEGKGPK